MKQDVTIEELKKDKTVYEWLRAVPDLLDFGFTKEEIEKAIEQAGITVEGITTTKGFKQIPTYLKTVQLTKESYTFTSKEYNGAWEKEMQVRGVECRVPSDFQDLRHGIIVFNLLKNRYNWFDSFKTVKVEKTKPNVDEYTRLGNIPQELHGYTVEQLLNLKEEIEVEVVKSKWDIYGITKKDYDIYLKTQFGSLYVPIKAILNKDFSLIEERMNKYFKGYYNNKEEALIKALKPLESEEAQALKKYLSE